MNIIARIWDLILGIDETPSKPSKMTPQDEAEYAAYRQQKDEAYKRYMQRAEANHPNPDCPMRAYAALHFYGEPAFSVGGDGTIKPDTCICTAEDRAIVEDDTENQHGVFLA